MPQERSPRAARISPHRVAALYDRLAGLYDVWGFLTETRARGMALDLAAVRSGERVLEVAVGTGAAFERLVRGNHDGQTLGVDIAPRMLAKAARRVAKARLARWALARASALALPVGTGSVDLVLNSYMFDLMDERSWPAVLSEFHRVLRPDGRLVLVGMTFGEGFGTGIYDGLFRLSPSLMGGCRGVAMSNPLRHAGFAVRHREYIQQLLFPSEVILASKAVSGRASPSARAR